MNGYTLILNAAEARIQFVVAQESILCAEDWSAPSKGTELLTPVLADALQRLHLSPSAITQIACVAGPGSFTGLRLVLTTAAAFRRATGAKLAALNNLHALAASFPAQLIENHPVRLRVITHARRGLVHGQDFSCHTGIPTPLGEPEMWDLETVWTKPTPDFILGSGVSRNRELLGQHFQETVLLEEYNHPTAQSLLELANGLPPDAWDSRDLDPLYLRPCDAVENLASIARKRGQNPEEAYAELNRLLQS